MTDLGHSERAQESVVAPAKEMGSGIEPEQLAYAAKLGLTPEQLQYELDMGNLGVPDDVTPIRCAHGVNVWRGHECGACGGDMASDRRRAIQEASRNDLRQAGVLDPEEAPA